MSAYHARLFKPFSVSAVYNVNLQDNEQQLYAVHSISADRHLHTNSIHILKYANSVQIPNMTS